MHKDISAFCPRVLSRALRRFAFLLAGLSCFVGMVAQAQDIVPLSATNQLIIQLRDDGKRELASARHDNHVPGLTLPDGRHLSYVRSLGDGSIVVQLPEAVSLEEADALVAELAEDPAVQNVQIDKRVRLALVPNDPNYADQWYLFEDTAGIRMEPAWNLQTGSSSVVIAVLDSGILPHAELAPARILAGYDFISDIPTANDGNGRDGNPTDPGDAVVANECGANDPPVNQNSSWHGLSVTGVIAATSDNNNDIAGLDFAARVLPVRVLGKCGGFISDIIDAIRWAAGLPVAGVPANNNPAKVINLSLAGLGACSAQEQQAIDDAVAAGAVVVVAAGNESLDVASYSPANCNNVIAVGAIGRDGSRAFYMNVGEEVDLAAPGGTGVDGILTLFNNGAVTAGTDALAYIQGTSFTTAQVSAVASLMWAVNNALDPATIKDILRATTRDFPDASCNTNLCGSGVLDANAALVGAANPDSVVTSRSASSSDGGGDSGGGGCTLQPVQELDPVLPFLVFAAFIGLRRRIR